MLRQLIKFFLLISAPEEKIKKIICSEQKCTFCGKCEQNCPQNAIVIDKFTRIYYSYRCNNCGLCVKDCPAAALEFNQ
jgi:ferredoxin